MNGKVKGLAEMVQDKMKWIVHNGCVSHCFNLVGQFASRAIPFKVEKLIRAIYTHFSCSSVKTAQWLDLQETMNIEAYKIQNYVITRWLSLEACVSRVLQRWAALNQYFQTATGGDVKGIKKLLWDSEVKIYLQFLNSILKSINSI